MRLRAGVAAGCIAVVGVGCPAPEPTAPDVASVADADTMTEDVGVVEDGAQPERDAATDADAERDLGDGELPAIRSIPEDCDGSAPSGGTDWTGWANVQFPRIVEVAVGEPTPPIFGQVWQEGATDQPGQASGWEAELVVGPLGADPIGQPRCFRAVDAEFNVDAENNDEYWTRVVVDRPGLFSMFYRFRPAGGAWLYGDLDGSMNGVAAEKGAILIVEPEAVVSELRAVTLNLKCRTATWDVRMPLVVETLVALDPHVVGFQEDCEEAGGEPQAFELAAALADRLDRGYEVFRVETHQANHPEGDFDEGIAMLTSFPIEQHFTVDLPFANFPRKATVMDVRIGGEAQVRLVNTHFDYGGANDAIRAEAAALITAQNNGLPLVVTGDFNDTPDSAAYAELTSALQDAWIVARPGEDGFTIPSDGPTRRIDYIFVSGLDVESASVFDGPTQTHISDHLGVAADLRGQ